MKKTFFLLMVMAVNAVVGQAKMDGPPPPTQDSLPNARGLVPLDSIAAKQNQLNKINMTILAGWASVNIVQSSIAATNAKGSDKAFFQMNAYWNTVNLAIAGLGFYSAKKAMNKKATLSQNLKAQGQLEKVLLLNTGLDVGYILGGMYLNERGQRLAKEQTQGFGKSIVLQGSFLLVFDVVQYFLHRANGKHLDKWMNKLDIVATENGFGAVYKL